MKRAAGASLGILPVLAAQAQEKTRAPVLSFDRIVPDSAWLFASTRNPADLGARFGSTGMGRFWTDPRMLAYLAAVLEAAYQDEEIGPAMRDAAKVLRAAAGVLKGCEKKIAAYVRKRDDRMEFAVLAHARNADDLLGRARELLGGAFGRGVERMEEGIPVFDLGPVTLAALDGCLVFGTDLREPIQALRGSGAKYSLANDPGYRAARQTAGETGLFLYANLNPVIDGIQSVEGKNFLRDWFRAAAFGLRLEEKETRLYFRIPGEGWRKHGKKLFPGVVGRPPVPADADGVLVAALDVSAVVDGFARLFEDLPEEFRAALDMFKAFLGIDPKEDFFDLLHGPVLSWNRIADPKDVDGSVGLFFVPSPDEKNFQNPSKRWRNICA